MDLSNIVKKSFLGLGKFLGYTQGEFDGVKYSKDRGYRQTSAVDSKVSLNTYTRTRALSLARWAVNNVGYVRGAVNGMARYSIGPNGLIPQAQTSDEKWNQAAEDYYREASKVIDVTGRFTMAEMQRLLCRAIDRDGDTGILLTESASGFPQIQAIEGHRIGNGSGSNEGVVDGIILNKIGRPVAYRIILDDGKTQDIDARNFIHLYDPDRCDQYRGVTGLIHALNDIQDLQEILSIEKQGVKASLSPGLVLYTDDAEDELGPVVSDGGVSREALQGGMIVKRRLEDRLESFQSNRPTTGLDTFGAMLIRNVSNGMGLPFEFVHDPTKLGGATVRLVLNQAQRRFEERQQLFIDRFLNRIYGYIISKGIKNGDLSKNKEWWRVSWQGPAKISVDAGRDAKANRDDIIFGNRTFLKDVGEQGDDWRSVIEQKAIEAAFVQEMSIKYKVPVDRISALSPNTIQAEQQAASTNQQEENK